MVWGTNSFLILALALGVGIRSTVKLCHFFRTIKAAKSALVPSGGNLQIAEGEIVLDIEGTVPTQPVLQHIGITAWPGE